MPNFAGKVIDAGRLRLLDCIGTGAYGKVYRAVDTTTPKSDPAYFAIKCLRVPEPASLEGKLQLREFTNHLAVSHHPNIVSFHKLLHPNGDFRYVVLDLCAGGDLFEAIVERNYFVGRTDRIKIAFLQLVDAISFCHQHSVYHRDIKPENVLCSKDYTQVYIADFGLSTQAPVSRDFRCGSVEYMSPDCIAKDFDFRNRSYSTRCNDIWALGIVLVNMITQRTPWNYARPTDACFAAF
ncbi:Pkinase-domain-containing protein, partial [Hymenopellis radicata]